MWEGGGRRAEELQRTPMEFAGEDLVYDLGKLAAEREFLQAARTLLGERALALR